MLTLAIPVYNMEPLLKRCMDTLLAQTCRDFEIVLIDDGSTAAEALIVGTPVCTVEVSGKTFPAENTVRAVEKLFFP